jgi:hypothetical protein
VALSGATDDNGTGDNNGSCRFCGTAAYRQSAQVELDKRADQLADRVDKIKERGLGTIGKHDKVLDGIEGQIDQMDAMVREGSNNAPDGPLPGSPSPSGT